MKNKIKLSMLSLTILSSMNAFSYEAFDFFSDFVKAGDMEMHTAGSLDDGKMVWALAKVNESFELFKGDKVDSYLLFSNPHQYGKSSSINCFLGQV